MHHDLQAVEEIQYLQSTISIKNHREESVMKHCPGVQVNVVTGLLM